MRWPTVALASALLAAAVLDGALGLGLGIWPVASGILAGWFGLRRPWDRSAAAAVLLAFGLAGCATVCPKSERLVRAAERLADACDGDPRCERAREVSDAATGLRGALCPTP